MAPFPDTRHSCPLRVPTASTPFWPSTAEGQVTSPGSRVDQTHSRRAALMGPSCCSPLRPRPPRYWPRPAVAFASRQASPNC